MSADAIQQLHDSAVQRGDAFYCDPETGLWVQTSKTLGQRGHCCGSGCRHCPYPPDEQRRAGRKGA